MFKQLIIQLVFVISYMFLLQNGFGENSHAEDTHQANSHAADTHDTELAGQERAHIEETEQKGPQLHSVSDLFLDGYDPNPLPTPTPAPPADAFAEPELDPDRPIGVQLPPLLVDDATSSVLHPSPTPTHTPTMTPLPTATPLPTLTPTPTPLQAPTSKRPLDINTASVQHLAMLPGVDLYRARLIASHRIAIGRFDHVGQLHDVFGITEQIFNQIVPLVVVKSRNPGGPTKNTDRDIAKDAPMRELPALPTSH